LKLVPWSIRKRLKIIDSSRVGYVFSLPKIGEVHHTYKYYYPKNLGYQPHNFSIEKDWISCEQKTWLAGDTLYLTIDLDIRTRVLPPEKYDEAKQVITQLKEELGVIVREVPRDKAWRRKKRKERKKNS
ncbi:MAG: hypothetical protein AAFR59_04475, partial [Bacteroidota bacterium]